MPHLGGREGCHGSQESSDLGHAPRSVGGFFEPDVYSLGSGER
jgi:hypothetical protein